MADFADIHFQFDEFPKAIKDFEERILAQLEAQAETAIAAGDEQLLAIVRTQQAELRTRSSGGGAGAAAAPPIEQATAAMQRLNTLRQLGRKLDIETLETLRAQNAARNEQLQIVQRLQSTPSPRQIPKGYTPYLPTAIGPSVEERLAQLDAMAAAARAAQGPLYVAPEQRAARTGPATGDEAARAEEARIWAQIRAEAQAVADEEARIVALTDQEIAARYKALGAVSAEVAAETERLRLVSEAKADAYAVGQRYALAGQVPSTAARKQIMAPEVEGWTAADAAVARYNLALGQYDTYATMAGRSTENLTVALTREGIAANESSNALRKHGALTTEYLSALARGETTVSEFGYQIGATISKFAGWTAAAAAVYGALGVVKEFGTGAIDTASAVQRLNRTIDDINPARAATQLERLSQETNVTMKEAGDAVFQFSRTFNNLPDSITVARSGLSALKLDNVSLADQVKAVTAIHQQFGISAAGMGPIYDMLSAGQREYNARISEMIPLLQKSTGAVHNAGGDLDQLIQLGVYAQRITQLGGAQIGTAFYRSAATFLSPNTTKGRTDRSVLETLGINPNQGWTEVLRDALVKSVTLSANDRAKLSNAIFGPQYGGRIAGIFSPAGVPTFEGIAGISGDPRRAITRNATQGSLQKELQAELATTGERVKSFKNELGRLGAAFGESGAITAFNTGLAGLVGVLSTLRSIVDGFAGLSSPLKDSVLGIEALTAALLFMSRTRFGSSIADLVGFGARDANGLRRFRASRLPLVGASEATSARFDLRVGTRGAQDAVEAEIQSSNQAIIRNQAAQLTLRTQIAALQDEELAPGETAAQALERQNALEARISALQIQRAELLSTRNAQQETLTGLEVQQAGLKNRRGPKAWTDEQVLALNRKVNAGTYGAERAAPLPGGTPGEQLSLFDQTAEGAGSAEVASRMSRVRAAAARAGSAVGEAATGIAGFAASLDPLLVAMLALPLALSEFSSISQESAAEAQRAKAALNAPIANFKSLSDQILALQKSAEEQSKSHLSGDPLSAIAHLAVTGVGVALQGISPQRHNSVADALKQWGTGINPAGAQRAIDLSGQLAAVGDLYSAQANVFGRDAQAMVKTRAGQQKLYQVTEQLKQSFARAVEGQGLPATEVAQLEAAFARTLQTIYGNALAKANKGATGQTLFQTDLAMNPADLAKQLQANEDTQKVFGQDPRLMARTLTGYAALATEAARPGQAGNDALMQQVSQAQANYANAVAKNAQDLVHHASLRTTYGGQIADLNAALSGVKEAEKQVREQMVKFRDAPKVVEALQQLLGLISDSAHTAQQGILQAMQSQAALAASAITGISPESDLARAKADVSALGKQLAYAQEHGFDATTVGDLQTRLNSARNALFKSQADSAKAIVDAKDKLAESAITGISPEDDIRRAELAVQSARNVIAIDQSQGRGTAQSLSDQAALNDAIRGLNQAMQQRSQQVSQDAAAFIQAEAGLAEAQTLDPVQAARDQLAADIRVLATIRPKDYKNYQEYQTALLNQQAKVAQDQRTVQSQIVDTQTKTLQFQLHTQQITDQQYVQGLEHLLKMTKLTQAQRQDLLTQIYDVQHQTALNLNVGDIRLPTNYEVRRAILGAGQRGRVPSGAAVVQQNNNNVQQTVHMTINVSRDADLKKLTTALDGALKSNFTGSAQAMGLI